MTDVVHAALQPWGNFYLVTGTAAAALTGLQFVVQTLAASVAHGTGADPEGGVAAFGTPTVVHFTVALVLSSLLSAPWPDWGVMHVTLALIGAVALAYSVVVLRHARRQQSYEPTWYDWTWHIVLPAVAYASLMLAGVALGHGGQPQLFAIAGTTLLLICVGIHNAWDTVTYITVTAVRADNRARGEGENTSGAA